MGCFRIVFLGIILFLLTCGLCLVVNHLVQFNPLYGMVLFLVGSLGVVVALDAILAFILP